MSLKNKVDVRIAGKDYTLMGVECDEYIQKVALYIDKKLNEVMRSNNKLSTSMAAILTSINVADDYFKSVENENSLKNELQKAQDEIKRLRDENLLFSNEIDELTEKNTNLQVDIAKKETELIEVRNTLEMTSKVRLYAK